MYICILDKEGETVLHRNYKASAAPASVLPGYHKILEWVKRKAPTAISCGRGEVYEIVEMTKDKLSHRCGRSLPLNDKDTLSQARDAIGPLFFRSPSVISSGAS